MEEATQQLPNTSGASILCSAQGNTGGDVNERLPPLLLHPQDIVSLNELILLNPPVLISWETGWERCFPKEALPGQHLYIPISSSHLLPFPFPPGDLSCG